MNEQLKTVLALFAQPAFLAKDGTVLWCNHAASSLMAEGTALYRIIENEDTLYSHWNRTGSLNLSLFLGGYEYEAVVVAQDEYDLFVASKRTMEQSAEAFAFVSASVPLRKQLHSIVNAADSLFDQLPEQYSGSKEAAQLNQTIYRLLRLCSQMADGGELILGHREAQKQSVDLICLLTDFVSQAKPLAASVGVELVFESCAASVPADADPALLERALYNLLTNALTYSPNGGTVTLKAEKQGSLLLISMSDSGEGISPAISSALFRQYAQRGLGDPRRGLGLGLPIVREIARLHGGSLSISDHPDHPGTLATFSVSLTRSALPLKSNAIRYDYSGEFNHGLIELSEVLDAELYHPGEVQS